MITRRGFAVAAGALPFLSFTGIREAWAAIPDYIGTPDLTGLTKRVVNTAAAFSTELGKFGGVYSSATDYLELAEGVTFSNDIDIQKSGTSTAPLWIVGKASSGLTNFNSRWTFTGKVTVKGNWVGLTRLKFVRPLATGTHSKTSPEASPCVVIDGFNGLQFLRNRVIASKGIVIDGICQNLRLNYNEFSGRCPTNSGNGGANDPVSQASIVIEVAAAGGTATHKNIEIARNHFWGGNVVTETMALYIAPGNKGGEDPDNQYTSLAPDTLEASYNLFVSARRRCIYSKHGGTFLANRMRFVADQGAPGGVENKPTVATAKVNNGINGFRGVEARYGKFLRCKFEGGASIEGQGSDQDWKWNDWSDSKPVDLYVYTSSVNVKDVGESHDFRFVGNEGGINFGEEKTGGDFMANPGLGKVNSITVKGHIAGALKWSTGATIIPTPGEGTNFPADPAGRTQSNTCKWYDSAGEAAQTVVTVVEGDVGPGATGLTY